MVGMCKWEDKEGLKCAVLFFAQQYEVKQGAIVFKLKTCVVPCIPTVH